MPAHESPEGEGAVTVKASNPPIDPAPTGSPAETKTVDESTWKTALQGHWNRFLVCFEAWLMESYEIEDRKTTIRTEVLGGCIQFISCLYVLPVIPAQLAGAGYDTTASIEVVALTCAIGCLLSSYITNLPFIIAPPTSISIFLAAVLQQSSMSPTQGNAAVVLSGLMLVGIGFCRPLLLLFSYLIPNCIQASTAVGIGLITALAGAIEIDLVVAGKYTLVEMGPITPEIIIATLATAIIALASHYHYKGAFVSGLVFGTFLWWASEDAWPGAVGNSPEFTVTKNFVIDGDVISLLFNLIFVYIITVNGIARSMSDLAGVTNEGGGIPRGNWLFIITGATTVLSGCLSGPPVLISPESAGGIKAGARTGLSTAVCGILFGLSMFFCPIFKAVPPAGTSPLLLMVGLTLFMNIDRIKWSHVPESVPAFFVLLLIPFTYSILSGVCFGYVMYILIGFFTSDMVNRSKKVSQNLVEGGLDYDNIFDTFEQANEPAPPAPAHDVEMGLTGQTIAAQEEMTVNPMEQAPQRHSLHSIFDKAGGENEEDEDEEEGGDTLAPLPPARPVRPAVPPPAAVVPTGAMRRPSAIRRASLAAAPPKKRRASIIDMLSMDLDTGIKSMHV